MRQFCAIVVTVLTVAVCYVAWKQGVVTEFVRAPQPIMVREESSWIDQVRAYEATRDADWRYWRNYDKLVERGMLPSGDDGVDQAVSATYYLDFAHRQLWPTRWRNRWDRGDAWCEKRTDRSGPSEEKIDSSGPRPAWVGREQNSSDVSSDRL